MVINSKLALVALALGCVSTAAVADPIAPFGIASAYNLFAVGSSTLQGNLSTTSDSGRVAAANQIQSTITINQGSLLTDPYGNLANSYAFVAAGGATGSNIKIGAGGNAYALGANPGNFSFANEPGGGTLVTTGPSPADFASVRTALDAQTAALGALAQTGTNLGTGTSFGNPSWYVLQGNAAVNVFHISQAVFESTNNPLDIEVPLGSTVIIDVDGNGSFTLGSAIYLDGQQYHGDSLNDDGILFNFAGATAVNLDAGLDASVLAPYALLTGSGQIDGNFIAAQIDITGEAHNVEFVGTLPPTDPDPSPKTSPVPEPSTLAMMGTGVLSMAAAMRRKK